jgi:hypothetical protein
LPFFEWHRAGKNVRQFFEWDRNNDGFITAEEALYKQHLIQLGIENSKSEAGPLPNTKPGSR